MSSIVGFAINRQQLAAQARSDGTVGEFSYEGVVRLLPHDDADAAAGDAQGDYVMLEGVPAISTHACRGPGLGLGSHGWVPICERCTGSTECQGPVMPGLPPPHPHPHPHPREADAAHAAVDAPRSGRIAIRRPVQLASLASGQRQLIGLHRSKGPIAVFDAAAAADLAKALTAYCQEMGSRDKLIFHSYRITRAAELPELEGMTIAIPVVFADTGHAGHAGHGH